MSTGGSEEVVSSPSVKLLSSRMKSLMILSFTGMEVYWTAMSVTIENQEHPNRRQRHWEISRETKKKNRIRG